MRMANMKEAVAVAAGYLKELFNVSGLKLEEVERPEDRPTHWLITFSFMADDLGNFFAGNRDYKQVEVNHLGEPIAVRIRKL